VTYENAVLEKEKHADDSSGNIKIPPNRWDF